MPYPAKTQIPLTLARLKEVLDYDSDTGVFRYRMTRKGPGKIRAGDIAGKPRKADGYVLIMIDGIRHKAADLAWFHHYGEWPPGRLDHRDLVKHNNAIRNLRPATRSQNMQNRAAWIPLKGAHRTPDGRWRAVVTKDGERIHLGYFATAEEAHAAYVKAATKLFGEYVRPK